MKLVDLKATAGGESRGAQAVARFFGRLSARDGAGAGRLAARGFRWFGQTIAPADWRGPDFAAYLRAEPLRYENVRGLPEELSARLTGAPDDLYDGPIEAGASVFLVDVERGERKVTCGVVVGPDGPGGARVSRVFEPDGLAEALRRFGEEEETSG